MWGRLQAQDGEAAQAARSFERVLALRPDDVVALTGLAEIALAETQTERAIGLYRRALASKPDRAALHRQLEQALRSTGAARDADYHASLAERLEDRPGQ